MPEILHKKAVYTENLDKRPHDLRHVEEVLKVVG
jgi:hypothetical protein